ncbi:MAG: sigma-54-dependent Fis family transcriptional regulator [Betaproteobacteria bacterium]|nr:MAG: sigma-54-dependent Fis family transcriptional regulator [Betaproteobacteria bacterium]TMH44910.1 MAG: sigma-54-dependent Fis family transcriptional regulator [Betaproteobacteria bacterium]
MAQILVVDDEVGIRELLSEILEDEGHQVALAESAADARRVRERGRPDLVLLDIWMPDTDGITLLKEWAASGQLNMPVVMMSGHATIETAVEATRIGALDFLEKPIALQRLLATVKRALRHPESVPAPQLTLSALGRSAALADAKKRLAQLAQVAAPLMLRGERGMRAELFARLLVPAGAPFVEGAQMLDEAPSELLGKAAGGVLFLPDLSRLERAEQRHLEFLLPRADKHKARLVSFSPVDVRALVDKHEFDPDLCMRLAELTLKLPAVREFAEDVPDLASLMLAQLIEARLCPPRRLAIAALNALRHHSWPGNLAELESVVKDLAFTSLDEEIELPDVERALAARGSPGALPEVTLDRPYREAREAFERVYFENLLVREHGSMSRVAERSGLERTHLYRKLKALGLPVGRREE